MRISAQLLLALMASTIFFPTEAAELRLNVSGTYRSLDIEGTIEPGDYERFLRIAKENQAQLSGVHLYSPGGDFVEAMKIGRALRALELSSQVPMRGRDGRSVCEELLGSKPRDAFNCTAASAAFFIHIGGNHRGGTFLKVHRPFYDPERFRTLSQSEADNAYERLLSDARTYMTEMGIPKQIQEEVLSTPSDKQSPLDERTIRTYIWGDLPSRDEWRRAKCSMLSPSETQRLEAISGRLVSGQRLTSIDTDDLYRLQPLRDQQSRCEIQLIEESRKFAYERFFGMKPTDSANHNFAKWADAPRYLGRTFEDVAGEERFDPGTPILGTSILERKGTATSPAATLMDSGNKRKIVSWIVITHESPSDQFRQMLQATLVRSWGQATTEGNSLNWIAKAFRAKLTYESASKRPALVLIVELPLE